jgi:hypothetical protein
MLIGQTAVTSNERDLRDLSEAAWVEPASREEPLARAKKTEPRPLDRLLERYPDMRDIPTKERVRVFFHKIRLDLLTGISHGIRLGVLWVLIGGMLLCTAQVMAAGPLLRRQGSRWAVLLPYFEAAVPVTVPVGGGFGAFLIVRYVHKPLEIWHAALFGLLLLALTSTVRGWPWPLRLVLHAGWLLSVGMLVLWYV